MAFFVNLALGATVFSLLLSICLVVRHSMRDKTDYDRWLEDVKKNNVIQTKRTFSKA